MAEFCLKCWNRINNTNHRAFRYIMSKDLDLCEGCGMLTSVIVEERISHYIRKPIFFPFKLIAIIFFILWRIINIPYVIYKRKKLDFFEKKY